MPRAARKTPWIDKEPGKDNYYVYWYDQLSGRVKRRSTCTSDVSAAQEALGDFIIKQAVSAPSNGPLEPTRFSVARAMQFYLAERASEQAHPERAYLAAEYILKFFSNAQVAHLTPDVIKNYCEQRHYIRGGKRRKPTSGTLRRELTVLRAALNWSVKTQRLTRSPYIPMPSAPPHKRRFLDNYEIQALLSECREPHLKMFVLLALNTAGRKGALLELKWDQIDFNNKIVSLSPEGVIETNKRRATVPLNDRFIEILLKSKEVALTDHVIEYKGRRVFDVKKSFGRACERAGLHDVTPHTLRHTAASQLLINGVPIDKIAKMLGHSVQQTTERYAHLKPDHLRGASDILGKISLGGEA